MKRSETGTWRYNVAFGLLALAAAALPVRLLVLISNRRAEALRLAQRQQQRVMPVPARPGSIFSCAGRGHVLLAGSKQVPSCFADPFLVPDEELLTTAAKVGQALRMDKNEVLGAILARRDKRFAWIKRDIALEEVEAIEALGMPAVGITYEWRRHYPRKALAAAALGFRRLDGVPGAGLELTMQEHLASSNGRYVVIRDHRNRAIWAIAGESRGARDGESVYLCLDARIQRTLEKAVTATVERYRLDERTWGTGIVVEPNTGEVLAICSVPTFDPNKYSTADPDDCVNRAVSMPFEPGSVAKPLFAAAAVEAGILRYDSRVFCENGVYRIPRGGTIRDHGHSYGNLALEDIVVFSSNIGMAKVGLMLGNTRLYEAARRLGFGEKTGIELPGEDAGIVRDLKKWNTYSTPRVPFGQEVSVTAMQLVTAFCSLVNGGELLRPRLVDHVRDPAGNVVWRSRREVVRRVMSPATSAQTRRVLRQVVERGTGRRCKLSRWTSFGKTGTAQIPGPEGYVDGAYAGTFVGGAPAERPRVVCLISVYWPDASKGYYGATVAAPFVKQVLEETLSYLEVPSDLDVIAARGESGRIRR